MNTLLVAASSVGLLLSASSALGQPPGASSNGTIDRGQAVFSQRCKDCHDPAVGEAPDKGMLATKSPDEIFEILKTGPMQPMADGLSDDDRHAIAAYLTAKPQASP